MMELFSLKGKTALVTGGNRGIGKAISIGLATAGAKVIIVARKEADDALAEIQKNGGEAYFVACDIGDRTQRIQLLHDVTNKYGHFDILVNNAGVQRRYDAEIFPLEQWDEVNEINSTAAFNLCQLFGNEMIKRGYGKIINTASVISFQGGLRIAAYAAAKAAVHNFTKTLSNEWASKGININCIAPGYIDTDMNEALIQDNVRNQQILDRIPAQRWGKPIDLVGATIFLASSASDYVNGITIPVDGGWLGR